MAFKKLTEDTFKKRTGEGNWVICFGTEWCVPCKQVEPILEELSNDPDFSDIGFSKLDMEKNHDLSRQFYIYSVPAILFIRDGSVESMHNGSINKTNLKEKIVSLLK